MINESTLEYYVYYLRRVEGDKSTDIQEHRVAFERELASLLAHLERLSDRAVPPWEWPQESENRRVSQCIVRTDWLDNAETGRSCFAAAWTYGDVYWLQMGYSQKGETGPEIFASLRDEAWQPSATGHLLGSSAYLCGIAGDAMDGLALQSLAAYTGDTSGAIVSTHLTNCCARLYGSHAHPHITALLYPNEACEDWASRTILNDVAPRIELYKHKADRQLAWCEENYLILAKQEQQLRELLEQADQISPTDLERLKPFIQLYRIFGGNASLLAERQTTIGANLENLDRVLQELALAENENWLLSAIQDNLRLRQEQLEVDLKFANHTRQHADTTVNALRVELALDHLIQLETEPDKVGSIEPEGWPGTTSQAGTYPQVNVPPHIPLTVQEKVIVQHVYQNFEQVQIEKEFGGGYGGTRVLMVLPLTPEGLPAAYRAIKLGPSLELRGEREKYEQFVEDFLPSNAARVEWDRYYEQDGLAGLSYIFVGGGVLDQATDLEKYYRQTASSDAIESIARTLDNLLDRELGQRWYGHFTPLYCFFAAEYGQHLVEHLRLTLRPASSDALWPVGQPPAAVPDYRQIEENDIPRQHEEIQPGTLIAVEGMVVRKIKHGVVKLEDAGGQGTIVRVELAPEGDAPSWLEVGTPVGVRGEVVYNRRGRLEQIACAAFPKLSSEIESEFIELPGVSGVHPNPMTIYSQVLSRPLRSRRSYVHGDLHLRNVLVDEWGKGWLIDFARVEKRHNLFDFIKLETYVRLMGLAGSPPTFSLDEYARFEKALNDATLEKDGETCPDNQYLQVAYHVILTIRRIAKKYMGREPDFGKEYLPALFLYCLAVTKYYQKDKPKPTRLAFITASMLCHHLSKVNEQPPKGEGESLAPRPTLGEGNRWAVLVGVNKYKDKAHYDRLHVCVNDAEALCEQLVAGGFDPERVHLLTGKGAQSPTSGNILVTLKAVAEATEPNDLLLFYYSGHGDEDEENDESYLVTRSGRRLILSSTAVAISQVKEIMESAPARAKVIILDACYSGADVGGKGPRVMSAEFIRRVFEEAEGIAILASCKQGQQSYEWLAQKRSVFTHCLLEALSGEADGDKKGFITVQDASRHVTGGVKLWASQNQVRQTPTLQYAAAGDIILVRYS